MTEAQEPPLEAEIQTGLPAMSRQVTLSQLAGMLEAHFRVLSIGIQASNPMIPGDAIWAAIAEAMGNVLSGATQGPDLQQVLALRGRYGDIVNTAIRKRYPAITVPAPAMLQLPANMN